MSSPTRQYCSGRSCAVWTSASFCPARTREPRRAGGALAVRRARHSRQPSPQIQELHRDIEVVYREAGRGSERRRSSLSADTLQMRRHTRQGGRRFPTSTHGRAIGAEASISWTPPPRGPRPLLQTRHGGRHQLPVLARAAGAHSGHDHRGAGAQLGNSRHIISRSTACRAMITLRFRQLKPIGLPETRKSD